MALLLDIFGFLTVILRGLSITAYAFTLGGIAFVLLLAKPLHPALGETGDVVLARSLRLTVIAAAIKIGAALAIALLCAVAPSRLALALAALALVVGSTLTSHAVARLEDRVVLAAVTALHQV